MNKEIMLLHGKRTSKEDLCLFDFQVFAGFQSRIITNINEFYKMRNSLQFFNSPITFQHITGKFR